MEAGAPVPWFGQCVAVTDEMLSTSQAYEVAYRFVAQYYERERIGPFLLMLVAMEPVADHYLTNDPASWADWQTCVRQTLAGDPQPELSPPDQSA